VLKGNYPIVHDGTASSCRRTSTRRRIAYREVLPKQAFRDIMSLNAFPRAYLFSGNDGGPMTPSASQFVIRRFKHLFGKGVGLSSLRHIYISDLYLNSATKAEKVAARRPCNTRSTCRRRAVIPQTGATYCVMRASGQNIRAWA
jgi:hypothetical protein